MGKAMNINKHFLEDNDILENELFANEKSRVQDQINIINTKIQDKCLKQIGHSCNCGIGVYIRAFDKIAKMYILLGELLGDGDVDKFTNTLLSAIVDGEIEIDQQELDSKVDKLFGQIIK